MAEQNGHFGVYTGHCVNREDPLGLCRIKVHVDGIIEPGNENDAPWAIARGKGSKNRGNNYVPLLGEEILISFINGDIEKPLWEPGWLGEKDGIKDTFQDYQNTAQTVFGTGCMRLVVDETPMAQGATIKIVRSLPQNDNTTKEEAMAEIFFNYEKNSLLIRAESALGIRSGAIIDIDAPVVQIRGRKVLTSRKQI